MLNQNQANIIERKVIVRTGVVLYTIKGSQGATYFATVKNGKVTAHDCPAAEHGLRCYHIRDIEAMEGELIGEAKLAAHMVGMQEQYASDPRQAAREARETAASYLRLMYQPDWK